MAELSDAVTNFDDNASGAPTIFLYVVGRDSCAFHAPRGLAVNWVSARLDEVTAQRLLPQAIYLKACFEGPGQLGRVSESFPKDTPWLIHKARDGAAKVAVTRSLGTLYRL